MEKRIIFYGGRQAGMTALLTLLALEEEVICVIPVDGVVENTAKNFRLNIKKPKDINGKNFITYLKGLKPDLLICCHGRQILKKEILSLRCVNIHPCLYKYKGAKPIERLLADKETKASVAVHWMVEKVDQGKVITETFLEVKGKTICEVYNELYPLYSRVLIKLFSKSNSLLLKPRKRNINEK